MLIIRRHAGQAIRVGDAIEIEIMEIGHGRVKLGIHAPAEVPVQRSEVAATGEQNRKAASHTAGALLTLAAEIRSRTRADAPICFLNTVPRVSEKKENPGLAGSREASRHRT
jgi:carbon storage regulator